MSLQQTASVESDNGQSAKGLTLVPRDVGRAPWMGTPIYLRVAPEPILAFLHMPGAVTPASIGVLLCPPFGWEEVVTYRSRRAWAEALALAGHPALRIDLPGTADSVGSSRGPARFEAWVSAVSQAAQWLRTTSGCRRMAAIGIGLGGVIVTRATADGAPIDDLILWNVPTRGRKIVRELRAFAAVSILGHPSNGSEMAGAFERADVLDSAGRIMAAETAHAVAEVDLTKLNFPAAERRRVLMLGRDGPTVDQDLRGHLSDAGADVTVLDGEGYAAMMTNPRLSTSPFSAIAQSIAWLAAPVRSGVGHRSPESATCDSRALPDVSKDLLLRHDGQPIRETTVEFQIEEGRMFGILCEPVEQTTKGVTAVFVSEGAARRVGPSRIWVETARRWAAEGVPTLRLDQPGIGDTDGDEAKYQTIPARYGQEIGRSIATALDAIEARGLPDNFIVVGLCAGAYWSLQGALTEGRVVGCFAINPPAIFWRPWTMLKIKILTDEDRWLSGTDPIVPGRSSPLVRRIRVWARQARPALRTWVLRLDTTRRRLHIGRDQVEAAFDKLRDDDKEVLLLMSRGELLTEELIRNGQASRLDSWPNLRLDITDGTDHAIRPVDMQRHVSRSLDAGLSRVLARYDTGGVRDASSRLVDWTAPH